MKMQNGCRMTKLFHFVFLGLLTTSPILSTTLDAETQTESTVVKDARFSYDSEVLSAPESSSLGAKTEIAAQTLMEAREFVAKRDITSAQAIWRRLLDEFQDVHPTLALSLSTRLARSFRESGELGKAYSFIGRGKYILETCKSSPIFMTRIDFLAEQLAYFHDTRRFRSSKPIYVELLRNIEDHQHPDDARWAFLLANHYLSLARADLRLGCGSDCLRHCDNSLEYLSKLRANDDTPIAMIKTVEFIQEITRADCHAEYGRRSELNDSVARLRSMMNSKTNREFCDYDYRVPALRMCGYCECVNDNWERAHEEIQMCITIDRLNHSRRFAEKLTYFQTFVKIAYKIHNLDRAIKVAGRVQPYLAISPDLSGYNLCVRTDLLWCALEDHSFDVMRAEAQSVERHRVLGDEDPIQWSKALRVLYDTYIALSDQARAKEIQIEWETHRGTLDKNVDHPIINEMNLHLQLNV
jgi:hypothetical protein